MMVESKCTAMCWDDIMDNGHVCETLSHKLTYKQAHL